LQSAQGLVWLDYRLTPEYDDSGKINSVLVVAHDITELKQAEKWLVKLNECFLGFGADTLVNINMLVALCGELMGGTCSLYNHLQGDMLCSLGKWNTPPDYKSIDNREGHLCNDVIKSKRETAIVIRNLQDTHYVETDPNVGSYSLKTYIGKAVKFNKKNIGSLCVVFQRDVVPSKNELRLMEIIASAIGVEEDHRQSEGLILSRSKELRLSEEKFKNVFEYASVGKSLTFLDGTVSVNRAFRQLLGYTKKEMKNINWHEFTYPDDIQRNDEITSSILKGDRRSSRWEKRYLNKRNEIVWVDILTTLLRDVNGEPLYFITTVVDITEKKKSEEEIIHLNAELEKRVMERTSQLEEANKELQAFAYSVSHDLRAPLRAIDGFSKFVIEDYGAKLNTEGKRLLSLIRSNTQKMDKLITDILSLSRVTRSEHKKSKIDMTKMALSMFNEDAPPEIQERMKFTLDALPETFADPTYIKQVWINLISNAIKFSSLKLKPEVKIGGYIEDGYQVYYIRDNGVGFNPEYANKLFGVFQRLHKANEFEGTGVGLAIVQRIVHRHGGKVWAEGKEGKGATFYFSLPVKNSASNL
jgi:PAS domain S-box-containing protein